MILTAAHPAAVAKTSDEARDGRSPGDLAVMREPERARLAFAALMAGDGPDREERVEAGFARAYAAYSRRDWELNTLFLHPDKYLFEAGDLEGALPDLRREYTGVTGYLSVHASFLEAWPDLVVESEGVVLLDADRAVSFMRFKGHGRGSGLPLDWLALGENWISDGLSVRQRYWWDAPAAAEQLGVQLPDARR